MSDEGFLRRLRGRKVEEAPERRRSLRTATVFQVAKLVTGRFEELCLLRDVSPSGLRAEVYCPVAEGERVEIELKTEHRVTGKVVWSDGGAIGVHFDQEVPMLAMLAHCAFDDRVARIRPSRLACSLPAGLIADGAERPVTIINVSLAGLKIALAGEIEEPRAIAVVPQLGRRACTIRWMRGGEAGVQFDEAMRYPDFVDWRRRLLQLDAHADAA